MRCLLRPFVLAACSALLLASQLLAADGPSPAAPAEPAEMKQLFNGKDLTGWEGDMRLWSFKDGVVRGQTTSENQTKGNTFLVWKDGELGDFELRLSFRIAGGNSGVQYRAKVLPPKQGEVNQWVVSGYQAEVEDTPGKVGFLYHEKGRGYLCNVGDKVEVGEDGKPKVVGKLGEKDAIGKTYKKSDWNDYVIIAKGNHIQHFLNGVQTVDIVDNDPKNSAARGILALQIHAGPPMTVEFKNVRLKQN
ncbi:hypothetical protein ETAA8_08060 [Anatilimnocola aggregata]|uniref:3-keto-alpha-glucoside-1,2-lyase/3-keto-2-hydroxy-glucal hydratase domain-containing protein n=1 Tax=Anatilimnocola aggregata TaxID=2528021 RepID=A0A517Y691_9BACT|nr:DUF1080 domain-containing protein [Anatilimnocola aggregata]QDU25736.1 hypothetical protein ETAA8_08060 [Anatilimnocola aggregata]